jgi:hypothetical protein
MAGFDVVNPANPCVSAARLVVQRSPRLMIEPSQVSSRHISVRAQ